MIVAFFVHLPVRWLLESTPEMEDSPRQREKMPYLSIRFNACCIHTVFWVVVPEHFRFLLGERLCTLAPTADATISLVLVLFSNVTGIFAHIRRPLRCVRAMSNRHANRYLHFVLEYSKGVWFGQGLPVSQGHCSNCLSSRHRTPSCPPRTGGLWYCRQT